MKEKISASNLLKQSAMQICFLRNKKQNKPVTKKQMEGVEHQMKVSISEFKEMRGCYEIENFLIFFSFDEIIEQEDALILKEHKMIDGEYEDWYKHYSILQTAVYHQLALMQEKKELYTAKFFQKQGYTCNYLNYENKKLSSILSMGEIELFKVQPTSDYLVKYFEEKAYASLNYTSAKEWDAKYKFKDWQHLNKFVSYQKICQK